MLKKHLGLIHRPSAVLPRDGTSTVAGASVIEARSSAGRVGPIFI